MPSKRNGYIRSLHAGLKQADVGIRPYEIDCGTHNGKAVFDLQKSTGILSVVKENAHNGEAVLLRVSADNNGTDYIQQP